MATIKAPVYSVASIRHIEMLAQTQFGLPSHTLMERAGKAACDFMLRRWPHLKKIIVFCGAGNNGGDGYVLARYAHTHGLQVTVWQVGGSTPHDKIAANAAYDQCRQAGILIHSFHENVEIGHADLLVDAINGIGLSTPLRAEAMAALQKMKALQTPIFSLDIPTGIDADTGAVLGDAIVANATFTFIGYKLGLLTGAGIAHTGELALNDLQLPADVFLKEAPLAEKIQVNTFLSYLKPRPRDWHKGLSGHVCIIGGEEGFSGAAHLAGEAALRVGAGLVSIATRQQNAPFLNVNCPELMCHAVEEPHALRDLIAKADVVVIGPGLGQSAWGQAMWKAIMQQPTLPLVVDADGLNLLAQQPRTYSQWVLTPHPGEAARLLQSSPQTIQHNRLVAAQAIQNRYDGICVLKGAGTLIVEAEGLPAVCDKGNPGMATGGMGDVLSGVIGGLIAQRLPLSIAAKLGVALHAAAGDIAAKAGERGLIASDLLAVLRRLSNDPFAHGPHE